MRSSPEVKSYSEDTHWNRRDSQLFGAIVGLVSILYACLNIPRRTGIYGDDAVYVMVASDIKNAMASQLLPMIKPDYPLPGLPLVLAPFAALVRPHWSWLEWVSMAATLLSVVVLGFWVRRWVRPGEALAVVALFAFNPFVAEFSGFVMPAAYFTTAVLSIFLLLSHVLERPTVPRCLALGFLLGWACLVRPEGILLLIGVAASFLYDRRGIKVVWTTVIPLLCWSAFVWYWFYSRAAHRSEYGGDLSALTDYWLNHIGSGLQFSFKFFRVFLINTLGAFTLPSSLMAVLVRPVLILLTLAGIMSGFRSLWLHREDRRAELLGLGIFGSSYLIVHLFWHVAVPRYFIVLIPLVLIGLVRGITEYAPFLIRKRSWLVAVAAIPVISYSYANGRSLHESLWARNPMKAPPWRSLAWLRENAPPDARVVSSIASTVALYTQRPAIALIKTHNVETFLYTMRQRQMEYVVDRRLASVASGVRGTENFDREWAWMRRWIRKYPDYFQVVFDAPRERTTIYRIRVTPTFIAAFEKYTEAAKDLQAGRSEDAFQKVQDALRFDPELGVASLMYGVLQFSRGNYGQAEMAYRKAAERLPDSSIPWLDLATLYHLQGRQELALGSLARGQQISVETQDQEIYVKNVRMLQQAWDQGRNPLFFDMP